MLWGLNRSSESSARQWSPHHLLKLKNTYLRYDVSHLVTTIMYKKKKTLVYLRDGAQGLNAGMKSVVDPVCATVLPLLKLILTEPQGDFLLGALHGVAAMDDILAHFHT